MTTTDIANRLGEIDERQKVGLETTPRTRTLGDAVRGLEPEIVRALPNKKNAERFVRLALTELRTVPHLLECSEVSVLAGIMQSAQLGLEIGGPRAQAFLIPRYSSKLRGYEATFQLGYRGLIDIAGRSGVKVSVREVYANDEFQYEDGLEPILRHIPKLDGERGPVIALFAVARFIDGSQPEFLVMSLAEVDAVGEQFGPRNKSGVLIGPWADPKSKPGMRRKTLARRVLNYVPMPVEVEDAMRADDDVAQPQPVANTAQRTAEIPPPAPADDTAGPPGVASKPAGPAEDIVDALERSLDADVVDAASSETDREQTLQEQARALVAQLAPEAIPSWDAYRKKHVLVPDPLKWADVQAQGVIDWANNTPLDENEESTNA